MASLFSTRSFVIAMIFWGLLGIANWAFVGWMPTFLGEHFALHQGRAGLTSLICIYSGSLVGIVVAGALADRWSRTRPDARALVGVIGICICIPCVFVISLTTSLGVGMGALIVYGATRSFPDANMMPILCQITDARYRATALGLLNAFGTTAGGITIYVGGVLRDAHVDITRVFYTGAGGLFICAFLLWSIRPRQHATS
jgi:MFS family permease